MNERATPPLEVGSESSPPWQVSLLLFGSGLCALIYQTVWLREFRLIFGGSTAASAAVLAIFMGGLGLGGLLLGRRVDASDRPLRFYALLELVIAASAALTPVLVWLVRQAYLATGGSVSLGLALATILRLLLAALVLVLPTFAMGGTLPAAARAVVTERDPARHRIALLYAANTLGAVSGALLATFALLEHFGNRRTLWLACALNTAVAVTALLLARGAAAAKPGATEETPSPPSDGGEGRGEEGRGVWTPLSSVLSPLLRRRERKKKPSRREEAEKSQIPDPRSQIHTPHPAHTRFVYLAAGLSGFAFFLMELVWYRMLSPLLGGSVFTFGLILAVALLGVGMGGVVYTLWRPRRLLSLEGLALTFGLEALCLAIPFALGDRVALLTLKLRTLAESGFYATALGWALIAALVVFPASLIAGFQFPLLIALLGQGRDRVGKQVGAACAWNTLGAIAGSLAGGFGLLPLLSAPGTWRAVVVLLSLLSVAALVLFRVAMSRSAGLRHGPNLSLQPAVPEAGAPQHGSPAQNALEDSPVCSPGPTQPTLKRSEERYVFSVGSIGDPPVPSGLPAEASAQAGDPPDGMEGSIERERTTFSHSDIAAIPPGGSPGGAGGSPALPSLNTHPERNGFFSQLLPLATAIASCLLLFSTGPTAAWRHSSIGAGRADLLSQAARNPLRNQVNFWRRCVVWETDGVESSVALTADNGLAFLINGKNDGNARGDAGTVIMGGLIGAILHPHPAKALVIGLGTGSTAGWLGAVPSMERVDVLELEPAVLRVAQACAAVNHDALHNPKIHITIGDAREGLAVARENYDVIFSEPSNPYRAGVASLFTREFYQAAARKLTGQGLFLQWVQAYEVDLTTVQTAYATMAAVFPAVETWQTQVGDLLLVGALRPITYDVTALRQRIQEEPFNSALRNVWRVTDLEGFLAHFLSANSREIARAPGIRLNTDDRTIMEFRFARAVALRAPFDSRSWLKTARAQHADRPQVINGTIDWIGLEDQRASLFAMEGVEPTVTLDASPEMLLRTQAKIKCLKDDAQEALEAWRSQPKEPGDPTELLMLAQLLAKTTNEQALHYIDQLRPFAPVEADALTARLRWRQRRFDEAVVALESAFDGYRADPWPLPDLMRSALGLASDVAKKSRDPVLARRLFHALGEPFVLRLWEQERLACRLRIAMDLGDQHLFHEAILAIEPHVAWDRPFLEKRLACYRALGDSRARQAERDLQQFLRQESP